MSLYAINLDDERVFKNSSFTFLAVDKCQEVVILMKIYGTFVTCFASY